MRKRKGKLKGRNIEVEPIKGYRSDLYMHSYYQYDPASINQMDGNTSAEDNSSSESLAQAMAMTIYFASTFHSTVDIIFPKPPKEPPDGIITALIMIPITWICILPHFFIACGRILRHKSKNIKDQSAAPRINNDKHSSNFLSSILHFRPPELSNLRHQLQRGSPKRMIKYSTKTVHSVAFKVSQQALQMLMLRKSTFKYHLTQTQYYLSVTTPQ